MGDHPEAKFGWQDLGFNVDGMFVWEGWRRGLFAGDRHRRPPAWAPAPAQLDGSCPVLQGNIGGPAPKATDFPRHFLYLITAVTAGRESASVR